MSVTIFSLLLASVGALARHESSAHTTPTTTTTFGGITFGTPTITISTSVPSPSLSLNATLPSQANVPPKQAWCPSDIFCAGSLLQTVNIAQPYVDSKTFVDKPTNGTANHTLADFNALAANGVTSITEGQIVQFLDQDFQGEGLELEALPLANFTVSPPFLKNVTNPLLKAWTQTVHGFWTTLIRGTNASTLCTGGDCESTLIPLNHTFVVPGGRFREQYYWDSYFIIEGLIKSHLFDIANSTLQNFMDEIEKFGFIPNGGRIYYLNRSQPPLFVHMLFNYVTSSGDSSILERALPLAEVELQWWLDNRTINVTSPFTNVTRAVAHYAVDINTAPRPESYLEDYQTINGAGAGDVVTNFTTEESEALYAELASGAETGWDYSSRWVKQPFAPGGNVTFNLPALRTLNVRNTTPVCLNSMLYNAHTLLADLYELPSSNPNTSPAARAAFHRSQASSLRATILDLFWDPEKLAFYDFNRTSNARNPVFSAATFYPLWNGIIPDEVLQQEDKAFGFFAALNLVLNKYNGTLPVTFLNTGLQWDWPNTWPPHQYIALQALRNLPANITTRVLPVPSRNQTTFDLVPAGQLGINASQLLPQTAADDGSAFPLGADVNALDGTVVNGGNVTRGESWAHTLTRELSNRYMASAFCNWYAGLATGGSIPGLVSRLPNDQLNVTLSLNNTGIMFEKFSVTDVDAAGRGGEYTVQAGFGWTNGVVLWVAGTFGQLLAEPICPTLVALNTTTSV
ncbi:glycoside hydrolase family 37 protein [Ramaria rubella]|nr:glycoside hydrolase family 37 protein [Ramaria rubella]